MSKITSASCIPVCDCRSRKDENCTVTIAKTYVYCVTELPTFDTAKEWHNQRVKRVLCEECKSVSCFSVSRKPNTERKEKPSGPCIASEARRAVHHCDALRCMTVQRSTTIPACMNVVTLLFLTSDVSNSVEQSPSSGTNGF